MGNRKPKQPTEDRPLRLVASNDEETIKRNKLLTREKILQVGEKPGETRMRHFCEAVEAGKPVDEATLKELAKQFRAIVQGGKDPKKALQLTGKQSEGRKGLTAAENDRYLEAVVEVRKAMREGQFKKDALPAVAKRMYISVGTLERYYKKEWEIADMLLELNIATGERIQDILRTDDPWLGKIRDF